MSVVYAPNGHFPWLEADAMFLILVKRASDLEHRVVAEDEEELDRVRCAIEAYEAKRFPSELSLAR